jgi:hypothetical protein
MAVVECYLDGVFKVSQSCFTCAGDVVELAQPDWNRYGCCMCPTILHSACRNRCVCPLTRTGAPCHWQVTSQGGSKSNAAEANVCARVVTSLLWQWLQQQQQGAGQTESGTRSGSGAAWSRGTGGARPGTACGGGSAPWHCRPRDIGVVSPYAAQVTRLPGGRCWRARLWLCHFWWLCQIRYGRESWPHVGVVALRTADRHANQARNTSHCRVSQSR